MDELRDWTESADARRRRLRRQGEVLFGSVAKQLNQMFPGRKRSEEEFEQVCVALALFIHNLLDVDHINEHQVDEPDIECLCRDRPHIR